MAVDADTTTDVIVLGAGAAGLIAALTAHAEGAKVRILERHTKVGGTAAISGGIVWAPMNPKMAGAGISDSRDEALAYFRSLDHGEMDEAVLTAFVDQAGAAIRFLEDHTPVRFSLLQGYPDYYLERPGAKPTGGRALDNDLFSFKHLGVWADKIMTSAMTPRMMLRETPLGGGSGMVDPAEMQRREAEDLRGWGQALVGGMLRACLDHGIEPELGVQVVSLVRDGDRVTGVRLADGTALIARRGVVLATGGFEWNEAMKAAFLRGPLDAPASPPTNQGTGHKLAMTAGADLGVMTSAWWTPTLKMTGDTWEDGSPRALPVLIERTLPHSLMVNGKGVRFCNEANNYSALAGAFHAFDPATYAPANLPCHLIFDSQYRAKYPVAAAWPGTPDPDWMIKADTLEELGAAIGVDGATLAQTVATFNGHAKDAKDPAFGRGESAYDVFYGDRSRPGAAATLGPVSKAPFYAVRLHIGALGTNGGARTDADARVIGADGKIIQGLVAAGNVMACPTGSVYAGAGGTLGPALTFGMIAGRTAAQLRNEP